MKVSRSMSARRISALAGLLALGALLAACETSDAAQPSRNFTERLVQETATLARLGDRIERAYGDVVELWEAGWKGGPCVRMSEQGPDIRAGQAIINGWLSKEAAVRKDPNGAAALQQASRFVDLSEKAAAMMTEACQYK